MKNEVLIDSIKKKIFTLRGKEVILDKDIAKFFDVDTGHLNRAVRKNFERFPNDFMFKVTENEFNILKCQNGISSLEHGGRRTLPYAFTEQGVATLSGVLKRRKQ